MIVHARCSQNLSRQKSKQKIKILPGTSGRLHARAFDRARLLQNHGNLNDVAGKFAQKGKKKKGKYLFLAPRESSPGPGPIPQWPVRVTGAGRGGRQHCVTVADQASFSMSIALFASVLSSKL